MDRLASCHLMHGFLHVPSGRRRHPTAPSCQHIKAGQRSLSLADRRGIVSFAWASRRGLISPMPHHAGATHHDDELDGERVKCIHNMSLVMEIVDISHLSRLSAGRAGSTASTAAAALPAEIAVMPMRASFNRGHTAPSSTTVLSWSPRRSGQLAATGLAGGSTAARRPQSLASQKKPELIAEAGELMLSICYFAQLDELIVTVVKARDLPGRDKLSHADAYVKLWLVQKDRVDKRKTSVCAQSNAPGFNESFVFSELPCREMLRYEINLIVTVVNYYGGDEIGHVIVGALGGESGYRHWNGVLDAADTPVTLWHRLTSKW